MLDSIYIRAFCPITHTLWFANSRCDGRLKTSFARTATGVAHCAVSQYMDLLYAAGQSDVHLLKEAILQENM
jgi:hypothetical protein